MKYIIIFNDWSINSVYCYENFHLVFRFYVQLSFSTCLMDCLTRQGKYGMQMSGKCIDKQRAWTILRVPNYSKDPYFSDDCISHCACVNEDSNCKKKATIPHGLSMKRFNIIKSR